MTLWIHNDNLDISVIRPRHVKQTVNGTELLMDTREFSREQWDKLGYNEKATPLKRAPFTLYTTEWVKGDDLIYREEVVETTVDEGAMSSHDAAMARDERDRLLEQTDWTQLTDANLDDTAMVIWQSYRQALRDIPQQPGFPFELDWPEIPAME